MNAHKPKHDNLLAAIGLGRVDDILVTARHSEGLWWVQGVSPDGHQFVLDSNCGQLVGRVRWMSSEAELDDFCAQCESTGLRIRDEWG